MSKHVPILLSPEPPIIDGDHHSNRIEPLGGNAILNCEVRGDPLPTIQWSKSGINIKISNRIRQLDNGSLAIYGTVVGKRRLSLAPIFFFKAVNVYISGINCDDFKTQSDNCVYFLPVIHRVRMQETTCVLQQMTPGW